MQEPLFSQRPIFTFLVLGCVNLWISRCASLKLFTTKEVTIGLLNLLEEVAGAVIAVKAVDKLDPGAGLLAEGMAAFAGFKGVEAIKEHLEEKPKTPPAA